MLKFGTTVMFLGGIIFSMAHEASAGVNMDDVNAKLTSLEGNQQTLRQSLISVGQRHDLDISNVTQFCQDLKTRVEQQSQVLTDIQQSMEGGNHQSTSAPDLSGPCAGGNYEVIDDPRRASSIVYHGYDKMCDRNLDEGWYRFKLDGDNAVMPTGCVPENYCTTDAPVWLDLGRRSLPAIGQEVAARGCANWVDDCCNWETPVIVRNCGEFFVYKLQPTPVCSLAFCAQLDDGGDHFGTERPDMRTTSVATSTTTEATTSNSYY